MKEYRSKGKEDEGEKVKPLCFFFFLFTVYLDVSQAMWISHFSCIKLKSTSGATILKNEQFVKKMSEIKSDFDFFEFTNYKNT